MTYYLNQRDLNTTHLYVVQNCEEERPYFK